ncbi:formate/nitrite transporter family protein [Rosenbergiella australiborealis]|uniref:Formate/nitrite transporter family protein n=1 Tax=Rosenbergiella australiborealis TaxID=1544696 RepID=A0ABS5T3H7_9GAMM|nr:formate/nitrite transporter family protein [Rosenbergiella australiborealis]MBT0726899.1 formate/nitrite transporter family protein [Rosenbergiella australiborealis]
MSLSTPKEVAALAVQSGVSKSHASISHLLVLGFLGGAFIAIGFLLDLHVVAQLPAEWGSFGGLLGAMVFPLGLILTVLAGAELLTGNMMVMSIALLSKKISTAALLRNWFWVTLANFIGSLAVAWFFGHVLGMTEGVFLKKTLAVAAAKTSAPFAQAFISGIGCNWLVCLAVWLGLAGKDAAGKIIGIWFPVMAFVAIGFQHVVANMFIIPAAIFAGQGNWGDYLANFVPVFLGNAVGGGIFVGLIYFLAYRPDNTLNGDVC